MKNALFFILLILTIISQTAAQNSPPALQEAAKASGEAVKLFGQKKYDEALPFAQKAADLRERELGASHLETAQAYRNLGFVQLGRGDRDEAAKAFEKAVDAFEKNTNLEKKDSPALAELLEYLGALRFQQEKYQSAEKFYERAVALREKLNGNDAKETIAAIWSLGNLKRSNGEFREAAALYRRVYEKRMKALGVNDVETYDAFARYRCSLIKNGDKTEAETLKNEFENAKKNGSQLSSAAGQIVEGGMINGKAINLAKPPFTAEARSQRFSGQVLTDVIISEDGTVLHACAINDKAPLSLLNGVENAALRSTFQPATIGGKAVKVIGVLVYNFTP
jgi:tetratricopeptide (TPR) repeat protein